jgi:hypothetical protein
MARASHRGIGAKIGVEHVGDTSPGAFDQDDMADAMKGKNRLKGEDQGRAPNLRQTMAQEKRETESLIESFENIDPRERTSRERERSGGQPGSMRPMRAIGLSDGNTTTRVPIGTRS